MCLYILSLSPPSLSLSSKDTETRPLGAGAENLEEASHLPFRKLWVEEKERDSPSLFDVQPCPDAEFRPGVTSG